MGDPRGPKPAQPLLRRALFEDVENFFPVWTGAAGTSESFQHFATRLANGEVRTLGCRPSAVLRVLWLGENFGGIRLAVIGFLSAICTPLAIDSVCPEPTTALGRALAMSLRGPASSSTLLDILHRHNSDARLTLAIIDKELGQERTCPWLQEGSVVLCSVRGGLQQGTVPRRLLRTLQGAFLSGLGLDVRCRFYACVLNPLVEEREKEAPLWLCPVCLRKLAALEIPNWTLRDHYSQLMAWFSQNGMHDEAGWCAERFQVVLGVAPDPVPEPPELCDRPPGSAEHAPQVDKPIVQTRGPQDGKKLAILRKKARERERSAIVGKLEAMPSDNVLARCIDEASPPVSGSRKSATCNDVEVVRISGHAGSLQHLNGDYKLTATCNGRRAFCSHSGMFLYYLSSSDSWAIGPKLKSEAVFADCGPAAGKDFEQLWRVWDGKSWTEQRGVIATPVEKASFV